MLKTFWWNCYSNQQITYTQVGVKHVNRMPTYYNLQENSFQNRKDIVQKGKKSWNPLTTSLLAFKNSTYYITTEYNCKQTELSFKSKADVFQMYKKIISQGRYYTPNSKRGIKSDSDVHSRRWISMNFCASPVHTNHTSY